jgi:glycosyltransferase involved in cell wall biosynthesis
MAQRLGLPLLLTARGSDVNVALDERIAGRSIRWAISRSAAVITVSAALRQALLDRGIPAEKLLVIRNGVDLEAFAPVDREAARRQAGLAGTVLLSVGNLVPEKGHDLTLAALALLPEARLVLIGSGASESGLRAQAQSLGVADRVTWLAPMPQRELSVYYSAADVTVLASVREGMPNVLLESLACGTPAVASRIGGVPEVLTDPVAGVMLSVRSPEALASACREVIRRSTDPRAVRGFAESFGWKVPIAQQLDLLCRVTGRQ